jgi:hypothetical protein
MASMLATAESMLDFAMLTCSISECDKSHHARGMCWKHYTRLIRHGDPTFTTHKAPVPSGDVRSYNAVHIWLRKNFGSASTYSCVDCGSTADHWSYTKDDPNELVETSAPWSGCSYSIHAEFYTPRCTSCHWRFDGKIQNITGGRQK